MGTDARGAYHAVSAYAATRGAARRATAFLEESNMSSQRIEVHMDFPYPVAELFAYLAAHENQAKTFGVKVERLSDGQGHKDGVGSSRRLAAPLLPAWDEAVTVFEPPTRLEYRVTRGSPLRDHHGTILFAPIPTGTHIDYTITFEPRIPLTGWLVRRITEAGLRKGLTALAARGKLA